MLKKFNFRSTECEAACHSANDTETDQLTEKRLHDSLFLKNVNFNFKLESLRRTSSSVKLLDAMKLHGTFGSFTLSKKAVDSSDLKSLTNFQEHTSPFIRNFNTKNLLQFYSRTFHDYTSPVFTIMRNSQHMQSRLKSPAASMNWKKLSLLRQIVTGMKLHSVQFMNLKSIEQNIQSTLFTWLTSSVDDRFTAYPDEYILDILIITFMEHQGVISLKEFDIMLWTFVGVNENLVKNDHRYEKSNPRAEKVALLYAQMHREMLEVCNKISDGNVAIFMRLKNVSSKKSQMKSFHEKYFLDQHSLYSSQQHHTLSAEDHIQFNNISQRNIFGIIENKLNLNLFNKMKHKTENLLSLRAEMKQSPSRSHSYTVNKIKKLKVWLKRRMLNFSQWS